MNVLFDLLGVTAWREAWDLLRIAIDALVVYYLVYRMLLLIKGTQAVQMLLGITVLIAVFMLSKEEHLHLPTLHWMLDKFLGAFMFIIIVVFQADIRRALAQMGRSPLFRSSGRPASERSFEEVVQAVANLSSKKIGALVALERDANLDAYAENGIGLDARVTQEALQSCFIPFKQNPLHDGAVILRERRIVAARCILPFTTNPRYNHLGSRHRAAIGLSELTDAVVVVVSEETGGISLAIHGELTPGLDATSLRLRLSQGFSHEVSEVRQLLGRGRTGRWFSPFVRRRRPGPEAGGPR
jgi:diadenylate cyclase